MLVLWGSFSPQRKSLSSQCSLFQFFFCLVLVSQLFLYGNYSSIINFLFVFAFSAFEIFSTNLNFFELFFSICFFFMYQTRSSVIRKNRLRVFQLISTALITFWECDFQFKSHLFVCNIDFPLVAFALTHSISKEKGRGEINKWKFLWLFLPSLCARFIFHNFECYKALLE